MNPKKQNYLTVLISIITLSTFLSSCGFNTQRTSDKKGKQWVYIELTTVTKSDTTNYYYYGQVKKALLHDIDSNPGLSGLFTLSNIRYWNDNDLLEVYEDEDLEGSIVFSIRDIKEIVLYKVDPVYTFEIDELHATCKAIRAKNK